MFFGQTFCGGKYAFSLTPTNVSNINKVTIQNGLVDDLYISKEVTSLTSDAIPDWNYNTVLHALFGGTLSAGNVDYTVSQVSSLRLKRREKGTFSFITLHDIPIKTADDFQFIRYDRYARSGVEYEYAVVPVISGVEGNLNINSVLSKFDGIFIMEKEQSFATFLNMDLRPSKNRPSSLTNTLGSQYARTTSHGANNYYSGTVSGIFIQFIDSTCEFDTEGGWRFREDFMDFIQNGRPKVLKHYNGRMYLISVIDAVPEDPSFHEKAPITTFNFVEIGNCESSHTLYKNDLIDCDIEGK